MNTRNKFNPAETYELLLKQANAQADLLEKQDYVISYLKDQIKELKRVQALLSVRENNSLREENQKLTNMILELEGGKYLALVRLLSA